MGFLRDTLGLRSSQVEKVEKLAKAQSSGQHCRERSGNLKKRWKPHGRDEQHSGPLPL